MLEAILFLRWGVVFSSVPKDKLESPPGGRSTLMSNKWRIIMTAEWHHAHQAPIPHSLGQTNNTWSSCHTPLISCTVLKKKKEKINSEIKHEDASSCVQPSPYSTLTLSYTCPPHTHTGYQRGLRTLSPDTVSVLQLTPVAYNYRVSWLVAASPRHGFLCSDTPGVGVSCWCHCYFIMKLVSQIQWAFWINITQ